MKLLMIVMLVFPSEVLCDVNTLSDTQQGKVLILKKTKISLPDEIDDFIDQQLINAINEEIISKWPINFPGKTRNLAIVKKFEKALAEYTLWKPGDQWNPFIEHHEKLRPEQIFWYMQKRSDDEWTNLIDRELGPKQSDDSKEMNVVWIKKINDEINAINNENKNWNLESPQTKPSEELSIDDEEEYSSHNNNNKVIYYVQMAHEPSDKDWINAVDGEIANQITFPTSDGNWDSIKWPIAPSFKENTNSKLGHCKPDEEWFREINVELNMKFKTRFYADGSVIMPKDEDDMVDEINKNIQNNVMTVPYYHTANDEKWIKAIAEEIGSDSTDSQPIDEEKDESDADSDESYETTTETRPSSTPLPIVKEISDEEWINQINDVINELPRDYSKACRFRTAGSIGEMRHTNQYVGMKRNDEIDCAREFPNLDLDYLPAGYNTEWMLFADGEGNLNVVFLVIDPESPYQPTGPPIPDGPKAKILLTDYVPDYTVFFVLCTRAKADQKIVLDYNHFANVYRVKYLLGNFNRNYPTKILIHGWKSSSTSDVEQIIKNAYLSIGHFNIILVDWNSMAETFNYFQSATDTMKVAGNIAHLIDLLVTVHEASMDSLHIIGHSLGAHTAGFVSAYQLPGVLPRITGLDPAGVSFSENNIYGRLDAHNARFVDVIHTCGTWLGFVTPIGDADFFPNGGNPTMPGCFFTLMTLISPMLRIYNEIDCSHARAYEYYADSITSTEGFYSYDCPDYAAFNLLQCNPNAVLMGANASSTVRGNYYLKTNRYKPYAIGKVSGMHGKA